MKKEIETEMEDELLPEYDFAQMGEPARGKYAKQYREGTNLVRLDADVAAAFPDDEAVNEALRLLMKIAERRAAITSV